MAKVIFKLSQKLNQEIIFIIHLYDVDQNKITLFCAAAQFFL